MAKRRRAEGRARRFATRRRAQTAEVKRLSADLKEAQQRVHELYDLAPVAYVTLDWHGVIRDLNMPAVDLLGIERQFAIGLPFRMLVASGHRVELSAHLLRFKDAGQATCELRIETRRAGAVDVRLTSRRTADGGQYCFTAVTDLSSQRRAEDEQHRLEGAERVALEANRAKDYFIASLSHELRAPLAPVLIAISALKSGELPPEEVAHLCDIIRRNVKIQARLIDDLLDVSRIAANKLRVERRPTDIHRAALEALEMLDTDIRARELLVTTELGAPSSHVSGDASRLRQVFVNLIKNATKFTPDGGRIALRSWNRDGIVVLEVADSGVGIPEDALARIFERFGQAANALPSGGGGLGLGLAISKGIMELHEGTISAHSAGPGRGARFLVEMHTTADVPVEVAPEEPGRRTSFGRNVLHVPGARILLVEDEPDLAETLKLILQAHGYEVRVAPSAQDALAADLDDVGILVSDLGLPDLDGRELLRRLLAKHDVRAVALSGYGTEADVRASREAGFMRHLTKPIEAEELLGAIEAALASEPRGGGQNN